MQDGIGSTIGQKRSSEDFLTLDGKAYKMDVSVLVEEDPDNLMSLKTIKSELREGFGIQASCDLIFKPDYEKTAQIYLILAAFR